MNSTKSSGNVFRDLGYGIEEAANLRLRARLMFELSRLIEERGLTQAAAAAAIDTSQPRISDLMTGKIDRFTIDFLVYALARLGVGVEIETVPPAEEALEQG